MTCKCTVSCLVFLMLAYGEVMASPLSCSTQVQTYSGAVDVACPAGSVAVAASCNAGVGLVLVDSSAIPPPGTQRVWYLTPNAQAATGVHCVTVPAPSTSQVHLRCCQ